MGTVERPDGEPRTELRKTADMEAQVNGVVVFAGDQVDILEEGGAFHYIKVGRKKGYINASYIQLAPPIAVAA